MKNYFKKNIFFLLAIVFYLAGILVERYQTPQPNPNLVAKFEKVLHKKENELKYLTDSVANIIINNEIAFAKSDRAIFTPEEMLNLKNQGISIHVFKNDTLRYWTDNSINFNSALSKNEFVGKCFKWGNDVVLMEQNEVYDYVVLAVFRIKTKYAIENNYLKNEFHKDFDINQELEVSFIFTSEAMDVQGKSGDTILYLSYGDEAHGNPGMSWLLSIFYLIAFLFVIIQANLFGKRLLKEKRKNIYIPIFLAIIVAIRLLLLKYQFPINVFSQDFFDSQYFASSWLNPSLGDLVLNIMVFFTLAIHFFRLILAPEIIQKLFTKALLKQILTFVLVSIAFFIFILNNKLIENIIINSTIPFKLFNFLSLNVFSLIGFLSILTIILLSVFVVIQTFEFAISLLKSKRIIIISLISVVFSNGILYLTMHIFDYISVILMLLISLIIGYYKIKGQKIKIYHYSLIGLIVAILVTFTISVSLISKEEEKMKLKAFELINQRDDIGEILLEEVSEKIADDLNLLEYAKNANIQGFNKKVEEYLRRKYFKSYWNKYEISVVFCSKQDSIIKQDNSIFNCNIHFSNLINNNSQELNFPSVYFVNSNTLKNSYLLIKNFADTSTFYFTITPKLYPSNIGYPELLLNNSEGELKKDDYSYAKYSDNTLLQKSGTYNYPLNGQIFFSNEEEIHTIKEKELKHLIYTVEPGNYIVLSYKRLTLWNSIVIFSYLFLAFILIIVIFSIASNFSLSIHPSKWNFRTKLIISMLGVLSLTFLIIGSVIVSLNISQYNEKHKQEISQGLKQINIALSEKYKQLDSITIKWHENEMNYLDIYLRKLSEILGTDINLYDKNGQILATSRPEIYTLNLIGRQINPIAQYHIGKNNVSQYIHKENISKMTYASAYSQLLNENNKLLAIINMPYFTKPDAFREELTNLIVTIINIFVVIFVISMVLSVIISEQIISPLIVLQNKFKKLELGKKYEKIEYKRKDEVGELVSEYNKMVEKLDESIALLSKSERENAWRDMAKQIAHEIKNPLTPMKLSIQLLLRAWENQDDDFDYRLRDVSNTLIQQIETLKRIAQEFSDFAKMPKPQEQQINIPNKIEQMSKFYENTENVDVIANLNNFKDIYILADDKQISRAFINLIKNAIQAIPDGVRGKIVIDLDVYGDKVKIKVIDNGSGIPEEIKDKLFLPSFTTKSSGMGIGLAMVKNIIQAANGKINFKSEMGIGTTFIIEFPKYIPL